MTHCIRPLKEMNAQTICNVMRKMPEIYDYMDLFANSLKFVIFCGVIKIVGCEVLNYSK